MTFPVALAIFLKKVIGGKYVADRERIYRDFWRHQIRTFEIKTQHPNWNRQGLDVYVETTVEKNLAHLRKNGFDEAAFESEVRAVREWLPGYQKERRSKRALDNANKRWENKD